LFRRILIANDGSEGAFKALGVALDLAKRYRAELHMISVEELPHFPASIDEVVEEKSEANHRFQDVQTRSSDLARLRRVKLRTRVVAGHTVSTIVELVRREGFDALVVGFMGHSSLYNRIVGSTTDRLVDLAPCTVVVVK
jgi:nucleotide-binding universal stress UspA family protein